MKVCVIDGHFGFSVRPVNVQKNEPKNNISQIYAILTRHFNIYICQVA